jgi:peptidoglycan/xylan/chitin deacetylase (PgdA/CDA1 family)
MGTRAFAWPHGKRTAVIVSVLVESWSDGRAPSYFPRTTPLKPGVPDLAGVSWSQFGGREGVWRIRRILEELDLRGTFFCNGRSAELYPEPIAQAARAGHDIAAHGYLQDQTLAYLSAEEERATIVRSLDLLAKASGRRPTGWVTPIYGWSEHTAEFLAREGIVWCCDALDSSLPYRRETRGGPLVMIPWSDFVDNRALRASPRIYFDAYKDTFDYLHAREPMSLLHVGVHSHFGGRPLMAAMLRNILEYLREHNDVWFARHEEVAHWITEQGFEDSSYARRFFA